MKNASLVTALFLLALTLSGCGGLSLFSSTHTHYHQEEGKRLKSIEKRLDALEKQEREREKKEKEGEEENQDS